MYLHLKRFPGSFNNATLFKTFCLLNLFVSAILVGVRNGENSWVVLCVADFSSMVAAYCDDIQAADLVIVLASE